MSLIGSFSCGVCGFRTAGNFMWCPDCYEQTKNAILEAAIEWNKQIEAGSGDTRGAEWALIQTIRNYEAVIKQEGRWRKEK